MSSARRRALALAGGIGASLLVATGCGSHASEQGGSCDAGASCEHDGVHHRPPPPPPHRHDAGSKAACHPADLGDFVPVPITPIVRHVCTDTQIHSIIVNCLQGSSYGNCTKAQEDPNNESCLQANCLFSDYSAVPITPGQPVPAAQGPWGPFISLTDVIPKGQQSVPATGEINSGSCLQLASAKNAACAEAKTALFQCETAACAGSCPFQSAAESPDAQAAATAAYNQCAAEADFETTACKKYADLALPCNADSGTADSFCYGGSATAIEKMMTLQCGLAPDGGVCLPAPEWGFVPVTISPVRVSVCTAAQIHSFVQACIDNSAPAGSCTAWQDATENQGCYKGGCIYTPITSPVVPGVNPVPPPLPNWGVLPYFSDIHDDFLIFTDFGGCILAADPTQGACGQAFADYTQCTLASCGANCPIPGSSAPASATDEIDNCTAAAGLADCQQYFVEVLRCTEFIPSTSPARFCVDSSLSSANAGIQDAAYEKLLNLMCNVAGVVGGEAGAD